MSLRDYLLDCPIKKTIGIDCPGCGFQRSLVSLIEGNLLESIQFYPATIPLLITWSFALLHLKFKWSWGHKMIIGLFSTTASIILLNYVGKFFL